MERIAGIWSKIEVAGHPCDVFEPSTPNPHGFVVIYLHGVHLGRLDRNEAYSLEFARHGLPVICPITQRSWWTDRICREFDPSLTAKRHVLDNVLPYLAARWNSTPPKIALLGTSMGGQGALRFAFENPSLFPICAAVSPAIDFYKRYYDEDEETIPEMYASPEAARQDTATLRVHPLNWSRNVWFCSDPTDERWHESAQKLHMKLYSLGILHECDLATSGGGHSWTYYDRMAPKAVGFLAESLERERLRIV